MGLLSRNAKLTRTLTFVPPIMASVLLVVFSSSVIMSGKSLQLVAPGTLSFFNFEILIDGISAFFILIIGIVSFAVSLYSIGYSKEYETKKRTSALGFLFNIFILSMVLVVASNNAFFFLIFWELMSLVNFFLVIYDYDKEENLKFL